MPTSPPQTYSTALFDREGGRHVRFLVVPERSLDAPIEPPQLAARLGLREVPGPRPQLEPWNLPLLLDSMTNAYPLDFPWIFELPFRGAGRRGGGPSAFAQYAAFAPVIPVEASPVKGRSLASLMTKGGAVGAIYLYAETGDPVALVYAAGVTILFTAVWPVLLRLEAAMASLMGVELEQEPPDEPPPPRF